MNLKPFFLGIFFISFSFMPMVAQQTNTKVTSEQASKTKFVELAISGMSCQKGCADGIDKKLKSTDGIIKSKTSFDKSKSTIHFDPSKINITQIITIIEEKGYTASLATK